jgi:hypothetical protein
MAGTTEGVAVTDYHQHPAYAVTAAHDPIYGYVTAHGHPYATAPRPKGIRKRADRACFRNALRFVLDHPDHLYVEGLAVPDGWDFPVHHAWVAAEGSAVAVELTWREPGADYRGVALTLVEVARIASAEMRRMGDYWGGALPTLTRREVQP